MIALDTNVIVRFLVRDDEKQAQVVYARFKQAESAHEVLFISLLVVLETIWVLESAYAKSRKEILDAFDELKSMPILEFEKDRLFSRIYGLIRVQEVCRAYDRAQFPAQERI